MSSFFRKVNAAVVLSFVSLQSVFAQGALMPPGMTSLADNVLEIFTGGFVRTILAIFLAGSAIAYAFNKDNEKIKRSAIAIAIAAVILIGASGIVGAVWTASGG